MSQDFTPAEQNTKLAQVRTELALERTLLAWVRTAFAFLSAAVALNRIVISDPTLADPAIAEQQTSHWGSAALLAADIISVVTTLLLLLATWQYFRQGKHMVTITKDPFQISWPTVCGAFLVIVLGVVVSSLLLLTQT